MFQFTHLYLTLLTCIFGLVILQGNADQQPAVEGNYRAVGEYVSQVSGALRQEYFEEYFDKTNKKAVFIAIGSLYNETFVEDTNSGKTWRIDEMGCIEYNSADWQNEHIPPDLKLYENQDGKPVFPIRQLLNLKNAKLTKETENVRGIDSKVYEYEISDKDVTTKISAYWSDTSVVKSTPSKYNEVPIAYDIEIWKGGKMVKKLAINIHMFFHGDESEHVFQPMRGVYCPGLPEASTFKEIVKKLETLSFSSELVKTDFSEISAIDVWMEPSKKLYRQDFVPRAEDWVNSPIKLSRIASLNHGSGTVYEMRERYGGEYGCEVKGVNDLQFDAQTIVAHQNAHDVEEFFGLKTTTYYVAGRVIERGIECHLYHGNRTDWPPSYENITTLWEWCIANQNGDKAITYEDEHFPLVSLNIYITESPYNLSNGDYYQGLTFTHHFYNLHSYSNNRLETVIFDITPCFTDEQMAVLQFLIITDDSTNAGLKDELNSVSFIGAWKSAIYNASGLKPESLRVSKPVLDFASSNNLTVTFHIMDRHPKITEDVEPLNLSQAVYKLQVAVMNNQLGVKYILSGKTVDLKVDSMTRRETFNPNKVPEPGSDEPDGYSGGTMAAVAIVMLLVGGGVGVAAFVLKKKYYDTPR